jgi:pentatricopeptide repeat protein
MPLHIANAVGVKKASLLLQRQATSGLAGLTAFTNRQRNERLERFLEQQEAVGTWESSCAALVDAAKHGVHIQEANVQSAMRCCSLAGRSAAVQALFYKGYKQWKLTKSTESEVRFMEACGATGDFAAAHKRMEFLMKRDQSPPPPAASQPAAPTGSSSQRADDVDDRLSAKWAPKLSTELLVSYLNAAQQEARNESHVMSSRVSSDTPSGSSGAAAVEATAVSAAAWSVALATFVQLRANPATRRSVDLTPLVLQQLSELADRGSQWLAAVKIVTGAAALHCLVPPESYDAAIRATYQAKHHAVVVRLVERCLATRTPPSEASVRMALRSSEEVAASHAQQSLTSTIPLMAGFLSDDGGNASIAAPSSAWALSLKLYQGLKDNGLALLPQTFEIPIRACSLSGKWDSAAKILGDMKLAFGRRVPSHVYRVVLLSKIEHAPTIAVAHKLVQVPVLDKKSSATFLALLRCCVRLGDWGEFKKVRNEMKHLEIPESYESMKLQMLLALADSNPHGVVTRYTRWMQQTGFERDRVMSDAAVPLHTDDFAIDDATLRLVVSACERLMKADKEQHEARRAGGGGGGRGVRQLDPIVPIAHADALKRLSGGKDLLQAGSTISAAQARGAAAREGDDDAPLPSWLFREEDE